MPRNHASLLRQAPNTSKWDFPDSIKFHVAVHTTQNHASLLWWAPNTDFPDIIKFCIAVHLLLEKTVRFRHPDRAQKLISSSMSWHGTFHPPCMRFWVILHTDRQTDRQTNAGTRAKTYTSSIVGGKQAHSTLLVHHIYNNNAATYIWETLSSN